MIQMGSVISVADNSGAKRINCIKILKKGSFCNNGIVGDMIVASVVSAIPKGKVKEGDVVRAVIIRTKSNKIRSDGTNVRFDDNAAVLTNKAGEMIGTRVFGAADRKIKEVASFSKIVSLADEVI